MGVEKKNEAFKLRERSTLIFCFVVIERRHTATLSKYPSPPYLALHQPLSTYIKWKTRK